MKKIILLLTMLLTLACSVCFATDSADFNKQQRTAEKFMDVLDGAPVPAYAEFVPLFDPELEKAIGESGYANLQNMIKENFGNLKSYKFLNYQRLDNEDRLVYIGNFPEEDSAILVFIFNKQNKMTEFLINPDDGSDEEDKDNKGAAN